MKCLRLRVKDFDFNYNQIIVRNGKGEKYRITLLPDAVKEYLENHVREIKILHDYFPKTLHTYLPILRHCYFPITNGYGNGFSQRQEDIMIKQ